MEEKDLERIERYLRRDMPETERAAFEQELRNDAALQRDVKLHAFALEAIRLEGRAALKTRLQQRQRPLPDRTKKGGNRLWFWAVVFLGLALVAILVLLMNNEKSPSSPPPNSSKSAPLDSLPASSPPTPKGETPPTDTTKPAPPIAAEKPGIDKLFAENFKPYTDEVFASTARSRASEDNLPPFEQFVDFYLKGEHEKALEVYEQIAPAVKNSDNVLFFKANSLLALGRAGEAAALLEKIIANGRSRYAGEAKWYLALSLLKKGDWQAARAELKSIVDDENSARREEAGKLLKKIR